MLTKLVHQKTCKKNKVITDLHTGEIACINCGAVLSERSVDSGPESVGMTSEDYQNNTRVGRKISLKMIDMGLSTIIESKDRDSTGRGLSSENRRMFYRLRMWDRNSRSANSVKSFQKAFTMLDGVSAKLGLPESVIEQTAYLFRKIAAKKILAGRSTAGILCAAVYITCRMTNTPRTLQDIANAGNVSKKSIQRTYRYLARELDLTPEIYHPTEFVTRIAKAVGISEKSERLAFRILDVSAKNRVSASKNPMAMAAAATYLASIKNGEKVSQLKISKVSGISAVTIRDRTKEILKKVGGEING
ncbi:transcription initiation factor IIB [Nitrosopumilus piranensis]|uniref:Transcription factor TFIIB cyclin-related n=1 Tax=Nitrosopumilus piranensis TaxID=1582439 RepID=A0A0C5CB12_9ARCH|nr:TFIIB-type zinc ribbon-containing protein [Nitrosopumilus piranensis]AJM92382.1 Transcription factor TFIIB cyclin-related [Nitrosopumilus piranensis]